MIRHGQYIYASTTNTQLGSPSGTTVVQFKVTVDPVSGLSQYRFRGYITGLPPVTGLGVADDLQSLMIYSSIPTFEPLEQITKLPLCEDL